MIACMILIRAVHNFPPVDQGGMATIYLPFALYKYY